MYFNIMVDKNNRIILLEMVKLHSLLDEQQTNEQKLTRKMLLT